MRRLRDKFLLRMKALLYRQQIEQELADELQFHLGKLTEENLGKGMQPEEARRRARIELGGLEQIKEECRDARGLRFIETLAQDLHFGLRMLGRSPGFTAVAVLTLALGIGANTAIFSVVDAVLLRPLPYPHPSQLVSVMEVQTRQGGALTGASYQDFEAWRMQSRTFTDLAGMQEHQLTLNGQGEPAEVDTVVVTSDYFPLYEVRPLLGRTLLPEDDKRGSAHAVVISENLWRSRFGAAPRIVGSSISLDKHPFTVVGVMPASFHPPFHPEFSGVWIPLVQDPLFSTWMPNWGGHWLGVAGRLKPGVSLPRAQSEMAAIAARLARQYPATNAGWSVRLRPLHEALVGKQKTQLLVLLGAVGLLLLIACANISSLLLARASARGKEMGIRLALGAGRMRIIRQLLTESIILGLLGGVAGILLAYGGVRALASLLPAGLPQFHAIAVDGRVLAFALLLSIAASLLFGLAPALLAIDSNLQLTLREGMGRSGNGATRRRARSLLVVTEIALAMVLLVGAGLLLRSFAALISVNPGFDTQQVWMAEVDLPRYEYSTPRQWSDFAGQLLSRIQAQPGLRNSAIAVPLPLADQRVSLNFKVVGAPPLPPGKTNPADYVSVSPGYFRLMGIPIIAGRPFGRQDSFTAPHVAIISQALARRYFPHESPLGRHLLFGFAPDVNVSREIVGVVGDVRDASLADSPRPMMYVPFSQAPFWGAVITVKSGLGPASIAATIRRQVRSVDPYLPVTGFQSLSHGVAATAAQPRFRTLLLGLFGLIALALAASGIYGIISYSVSRRTRELGIRMALGATPAQIQRMVVREGGALTAAGLAIGSVATLLLTRFLGSELYGVGAGDPFTYLGIAVLLAVIALAASYIPACRATHVDPLTVLRNE